MIRAVAPDNDEAQADSDVYRVVDFGPSKLRLREQVSVTSDCLVKINEPERDIEGFCLPLTARQRDDEANDAKGDVKEVVKRGSAGQTLLRREQESCEPGQDQHRGEYGYNDLV